MSDPQLPPYGQPSGPPAPYGQQGYGQDGYGQAPHPPAGWGGRPAQPSSVRTAVRLMYAIAAIGLLSLLVTLTTVSDVRAHAEASGTATASQVNVVVAVVVVFAVLLGVVGAALWVLVAVFCGRGRNWARIFATVLAALDVLGNLSALGRDTTGASLAGLVQLVLSVLVIVFLYRPSSRDYFTSASTARDQVALRYPPVPPVR